MSYKSENWKEKLEQVRNHIALKEGSVEKTADEILESQIEEELKTFDDIQEVTDKEISAVKKLSKLIEKAKKDYQKIARMGDKSLQLAGFNEKYESILNAQQEILSLIGDLTTMKAMSDRARKEEVVEEETAEAEDIDFDSITVESLPYSVDCPPKNKDLKIKQNKKEKFVVRFHKGKKFYKGFDFDEAVDVFEETYEDKCVE